MTVEEIRERLLPWQREVFDWAMAAERDAMLIVCRSRRSGWTYLRAAIDEACEWQAAQRILDEGRP